MTGTEILNTIHTLYEQDVTFPDITSEDYLIRLTYLNQAIYTWENEIYNGALWSELFVTSTLAYNSNTITDLIAPEKLYVGTVEYSYVLPHQAIEFINSGSTDKIYYITGGSNNKVVNIYPTLSSGTFTISYYKQPTIYTTVNIGNHIEMSNSLFATQYVLSQLYASDGDQAMSNSSMQMAQRYLEQMKNGLDTMPYGSFSNIEDDNVGFGV
jgi:hypothetical protein